VPNLFHVGARLRLVHAKHIPAAPIEECRNSVVRDAMDVHRHILQLLHDGAELIEILVGRVLKIDRDMVYVIPRWLTLAIPLAAELFIAGYLIGVQQGAGFQMRREMHRRRAGSPRSTLQPSVLGALPATRAGGAASAKGRGFILFRSSA
jgi:hypothetical protein